MRDVLSAIRSTAARHPDRIAISDTSTHLDYAGLAGLIGAYAAAFARTPQRLGLLMPRDHRHVAADLALASLGRTIVPLPDFFSLGQWQHMAADAGLDAVVTPPEWQDRLNGLDLPVIHAIPSSHKRIDNQPSQRVIYTSGTTGAPKGVVLDEANMAASLHGLCAASGANADDVHLSLLPFSLLLEQLAGILVPLLVGARLHIGQSPLEAQAVGATTSIVVPALLRGWVAGLEQMGLRGPDSLRYVAAGGAPLGLALTSRAWELGLPVHEGYGLSECCSVVAVNRAGHNRPGTAGRPLDGVSITIDDGEIVVSGPTVMRGYLNRDPVAGHWRTGDLGRLDDDGNLVILGRKDDLVVTANGRNIHPEWIEPMILADPSIARAAVVAAPSGVLRAVLVPALADAPSSPDHWLPRLERLCADAPAYARPADVVILPAPLADRHALFTLDGRPRRRRIAAIIDEVSVTTSHPGFFQSLLAATHQDRQRFQSIPVITEAVVHGVGRDLYLSFLNSAYHHVRYTVPLLQTALAACGPDDQAMAAGLRAYIAEETGHEEWILDDIAALGGDAQATRQGRPPLPVRVLVAHAFHLIAEEGPYALLGMVHVLEGMSVALAINAAQSIRSRLAQSDGAGFSYLTSHGALDVDHVDSFAHLLDAVDTPDRRRTVIAAAHEFYELYGNVFRALTPNQQVTHAA